MGASHSRPEGGDEHPRRRPQNAAAMDTSGYPTSDEPPQHLTPATHSQPTGDEPPRREPRRRLKLGRRLSTLLGRDSSVSKRERSNSHHSGVSSSSRPAPKRPRLRGLDIDEGPEAAYPSASASTSMPTSSGPDSASSTSMLTTGSGSTPPSAYASAAASMSAFPSAAPSSSALRSPTPSAASLAPSIPTIATPSLCPDSLSPGRASTMHTQTSSRPASHLSSSRTTSSPPSILQASTPTGGADEFNIDRLHAMSGVETLGSERTPTPSITNDTPGQTWQNVLGRFRRTSQRGDRDTPTPPRTATPASTSTQAGPATAAAPPAPPLARSLQHRLSAIMGFSTPSSSAADDVSPPPAPPVAATPPANSEDGAAEDGESRAIPVGAVLVIQGLAQTHANVDGATNADGSGRLDLHSLEQQARMIGNLLTVAAAATATTLLSPETVTQQPTRATAQNAMQSIIERIRPHRNRSSGSASGSASPNPTQTIENALGDYLRHVLRDNRRFTDNITRDSPPQTSVPSEFQQFLHTLQEDLIRAVRGYAAPWADEEEDQEVVETPALTDEERRAAGLPPLAETETTTPANAEASSSLPAFHRQPGQVTAAERALGVSGGTEGVPRRLNFFRAHLFPPEHGASADGSSPDGEDDDPVVPSIFVGVRSIAHHANMTTDDLVGHPSFPFLDGHVPETSTEAHTHASDPLADPGAMDGAPAAAPAPDDVPQFERDIERELMEAETSAPRHRTLRERFVNRLTRGREPERAPAPLNTYLIYVIGGNYPRSHPILHIPALVTGGPLSADDLQLLSELLGPARPPTATADEIARAGLRVVPASSLKELGDDTVFDACVASCGVCLAEYEDDDECRVLNCKHAFHRECVDHWLCAGRNSCPTCRSEVVDKNALAPPADDAADAPPATDAADAHMAQPAA